jgi:hypothetical protein
MFSNGMTSNGIGDVRRVVGQPQGWLDQHFTRPEPPLPNADGDRLVEFLNRHVIRWESQVASEVYANRCAVEGLVGSRS